MLSALHHSHRNEQLNAAASMGELLLTATAIPDKELSALFPELVKYERLRNAGKWPEAIAAGRKVLATLERRLGRSHFLYLRFQLAYGNTLVYHAGQGDHAAEAIVEATVTGFERAVGRGGGLAEAYENYAQWIRRNKVWSATSPEGKKPECGRAVAFFRRGVEEARACGLWRRAGDISNALAEFYREGVPAPDLPAAERGFRDALDAYRRVKDPLHWEIARTRANLLLTVTDQRKLDEAEALMKEFRSDGEKREWHEGHDALFRDVAHVLTGAKRIDAALLYLEEAARVRPGILDDVDKDPYFAAVRETDGYKKLRERVKPPKK
jgi:tetratricopeptide (TPR) repeat protein